MFSFKNNSFLNAVVLVLSFGSAAPALAQNLHGQVVDQQYSPVIGATVLWVGTTTGTVTDESGFFHLPKSDATHAAIVVRFIGYKPDTLAVAGKEKITVVLQPSTSIKEVVVEGQTQRLSAISPTNSQVITNRDLEKSACCNLAESFETNASVEVSTTDAVSGAKQIQMLGLDGAYTLLTTDNIPELRGLAAPYRLNYLSGTFIESIDIIKGMGSVLNGYESISGQVNVKLKDPEKTERLYLNLYGNSLAKFDANLNASAQVSPKWSTVLMLHTDHLGNRVDRNNDGFMDLSLGTQYNVYNKWKYEHKAIVSEFGINGLQESRLGGQMNYEKGEAAGPGSSYGTESETDRFSAYNKTSYTFSGKPYQSIGLITSAAHHKFNALYGPRNYSGEQNNATARLIFQSIIGHTGHTYKAGLSYHLDDYSETLSDTSFSRTELVPGAFLEYVYTNNQNLTLVAGSRLDFHNLYGTVFTPRLNVKYDATPTTIFRVAAGKGFRVANPVAENTAALVSSRRFVFKEALQPEQAWNFGGSFTQYFELRGQPGAFITDYYYTTFQNQVVADMYSTPHHIAFYNLQGRSYSSSLQAELQYEVLEGLEVKTAYKYFDVRSTYQGQLEQRPMVPQHRFFLNLGFATPFDKWRADLTTQYFGLMPLATMQESGTDLNTRNSDRFFVLNGQVSRAFKHWDFYLGGENLLNYRQPTPILGASDPFGPNFDASMVWGPVTGRILYAGMRFKIH
ncbi:TonB-dependent receptor plug domain-containing protein [Pontibacter qinzhouensis]|uniref:TonB-dependent receptor plug domain-containing protein n=1 Tax=Pontibacter qinzhouensis TaxID=2603253 RepID=A0A5C8K1N6_9BACT|nr:TonB-dependent receptor [Pontibacter qinzhouensis]TXK44465.1 TonB-dependent receptor plug domain-containing protein [Pontibacter qinzhouensis]